MVVKWCTRPTRVFNYITEVCGWERFDFLPVISLNEAQLDPKARANASEPRDFNPTYQRDGTGFTLASLPSFTKLRSEICFYAAALCCVFFLRPFCVLLLSALFHLQVEALDLFSRRLVAHQSQLKSSLNESGSHMLVLFVATVTHSFLLLRMLFFKTDYERVPSCFFLPQRGYDGWRCRLKHAGDLNRYWPTAAEDLNRPVPPMTLYNVCLLLLYLHTNALWMIRGSFMINTMIRSIKRWITTATTTNTFWRVVLPS